MYFLNNRLLSLTVLVVCCCEVILSAPQYSLGENNDQTLTGNEEGTTEIVQEEIIPVNYPGFSTNTSFVPTSPLIYPPPYGPYNVPYNPPLFYPSYFRPPTIFPNIPPTNFPIQPPVDVKNIYLDYDENNNLISNSTTGFQAIPDVEENTNTENDIQNSAARFRQTTNNQTYITPIKSIKKHEYRTRNQESYIVAETYIRPNQKPKTIIRVYYDPSQNRENITIENPDSSKVIEIESNISNDHVITNSNNDGTGNNSADNEPASTLGSHSTEYSAWPFAAWVATTPPTRPSSSTTEEITTPAETTPEETSNEDTTPEQTTQISEENYEDVTRETTNSISDEDDENDDDENDDEELVEEDQRDDYNAIVPESNRKMKINNKMYERIPNKWLNLQTTEQEISTTTTETVPIWLRKSYTTPKIFAFNNAIMPTAAGTIVQNTPKKTNDFNRGWFSWKQPVPSYNSPPWKVESTTPGLRFAFFR